MLVLTRKIDERIQIAPNITITVLRIRGRSVQIGIEAPETVQVLRGEIAVAIEQREDAVEPIPGKKAQAPSKPTGSSDRRHPGSSPERSQNRRVGCDRDRSKTRNISRSNGIRIPQ
ncbi:MAG: carbon storage regulator [Rhodopirellula sp.]|nr:carbon storage regulator [Rhodopirellula sp.]